MSRDYQRLECRTEEVGRPIGTGGGMDINPNIDHTGNKIYEESSERG